MTILLIIGGVLITGGLAGLFIWWYLRWRRYSQFHVRIFERDAFGQLHVVSDRGGIFVDPKTNNKLFYLQKAKVGLKPDNIPYIKDGNVKVVYMFKKGSQDYRFINFNIKDKELEPKITEEDINSALNAYQLYKAKYDIKGFMEYMPYIMFIFTIVIILVLFIYLFKKFDVLASIASNLKEASKQLAMANNPTKIIR
jgi:hypothetical protein